MLSLGMDIGTSTVKLVLLRDGAMAKQWMAVHHGRPFACLKKGLSALELDADTPFSLCVTGSNTEALLEQAPDIPSFGDIPAIVEGVRWIIPQVGSVIEIGSQGARFITDLQSRAPHRWRQAPTLSAAHRHIPHVLNSDRDHRCTDPNSPGQICASFHPTAPAYGNTHMLFPLSGCAKVYKNTLRLLC